MLEDGKLHIYKDVYAQNTNTEETLRTVPEAHGVRFEDLSEQQRAELLNALNSISANPKAMPSPSPSPDKKTSRKREQDKKVKEAVVEIAALAGKGYPAPVDLDMGRR